MFENNTNTWQEWVIDILVPDHYNYNSWPFCCLSFLRPLVVASIGRASNFAGRRMVLISGELRNPFFELPPKEKWKNFVREREMWNLICRKSEHAELENSWELTRAPTILYWRWSPWMMICLNFVCTKTIHVIVIVAIIIVPTRVDIPIWAIHFMRKIYGEKRMI